MEALPYGVWGGGCDAATLPAGQRRAGAEVGWRAVLTLSIDRRRRTGDGAPYEAWGKVSALQIRCPSSRARGVGDAAPYGVCELQGSAEP